MLDEVPPRFPKITAVIYDLDGLLLGTEFLHEQVNRAIAQRYGKTFDKFIKAKVAGRSTLESAQILVDLLELPLTPQAYLQQRNALIYPLYPQAQALPGAVLLTQHLSSYGIPQAIASSSSRRHFEMKITCHQEWFALFDCFVLGDDPELKRSKPAPDIFLLAAQRLGVSPEECLVFEDSLAGMEAALAAGMSVVVVPDPDLERQLYENAAQILSVLSDFEPPLWGLPAFSV
jgi:pseudouridine-5'-monophosphatase